MIYLRMAMKSLKRTRFAHLLTVLQLAAALLVTAILVSATVLRFSKYAPFREYFNARGIFASYGLFAQYSDTGVDGKISTDPIENAEELSKYLSAPADVLAPYQIGAIENIQHLAYGNDILSKWNPQLLEGRMLNEKADELEAIVSWNEDEWQVGDTVTITMNRYDETFLKVLESKEVTVHIVGMLNDGEQLPGQTGENTEDFRLFWRAQSAEHDDNTVMLFSMEQLERLAPLPLYPTLYGTLLIRYKEQVTPEQVDADIKNLSRHSLTANLFRSMEEISANSNAYLYTEMYKLLPVIAMLTFLLIISTISSTALSTRKRLHDYAVFALSGLPWNKCIRINFIQSLITGTDAGALAVIAGILLQNTSLKELFYIRFGLWEAGCCAALVLMYLIISMFMPFLMIHKNSVREILKAN